MADEINIIVSAVDNFSGVLGNFGNVMTGIKSTLDLVGQAFNAAYDFGSQFVTSASESQQAMVGLNLVLQSTAGSAGVFSETVGKLNNTDLNDLYDQLDRAKNKLSDMKDEFGNAKTYTTEETIAIAAQKDKIAELTAEIAKGTNGLTIFHDTTQLTTQQLIDLSKQLENTAGFSDELVLSAETMMLRFENVNATIFPQAIQLAADLSRSLGIDLVTASQTVGKALDDPEAGIGRLNMQFKLFNATEMDTIKNMAANGDIAGAQALIMERLTEKVGGAAAAYGQTFAGQLDIAKQKLDDFKELIGGPIMELTSQFLDQFINFTNSPVMGQISLFFEKLYGYLANGQPLLSSIATALFSVNRNFIDLSFALMDIQDAINSGDFLGAFQQFATLITDAIKNIDWKVLSDELAAGIQSIDWAKVGQTLSAVTLMVLDTLKTVVANIDWSALLKAFASALGNFIAGIAGFAGWGDMINEIGVVLAYELGRLQDIIANTLHDAIINAIPVVKNAFISIGSEILSGLIIGLDVATGGLFSFIANLVNEMTSFFKALLGISSPSTVFTQIGKDIVQGLINGWDVMFASFIGSIQSDINSIISLFPDWLQNALGVGGASGSGLGSASGGVASGTTGGITGTGGSSGGGSVVNNYYGPVYFQGGAEPGSYYDCPSPNPLTGAGSGTIPANAV